MRNLSFKRGMYLSALLSSLAGLTFMLGCVGGPGPASSAAKGSRDHIAAVTKKVDGNFIRANARSTVDWPSYGLDYSETRFSRLNQINASNVKELGLMWSYNMESTRGVEATPIVIDGIMYVSAAWSVVHAVDVRSGKRIWTYDPKVPPEWGSKGCCDVVNRGVAVYEGKVFVGAFDGRLIALDAATGQKVWERDTLIDRSRPYTITGAPRVFDGKVIIGNGGAELGVRGYITAYDASSGEQKWRWFTVPGDPSKPFEDESMERAAKTWDPSGKYWEAGGGGTAWDTLAYDPELKLMYVGTGNGSPWSHAKRSPKGGDNLYLGSIVALNVETGKYAWHYQQTPGDNWDYTSTQPMILAELPIEGRTRKVILHAPKNGFFYVLDRTNGQFISAKNFTEVNWASGYDANGRPMINPEARSTDKAFEVLPTAFGARNWHSMSFNPQTGLVYMPVQGVPLTLQDDKAWTMNSNAPGQPMTGVGWNTSKLVNTEAPKSKPFGRLVAWDPVAQKQAWAHEHVAPWNGGTLSTAGDLVFQGTADGRFGAYNAKTGAKLWEVPTGTGVVAAPSTYMVDGQQYVSIAVGWGGVYGKSMRHTERQGPGTVYTFAIGGKAAMPDFVNYRMQELVSGVKYNPADVQAGTLLYVSNCVFCHGVPGVDRGGNIPNLGYIGSAYVENLQNFVYKNPSNARGMPDFTGKLSAQDVEKIKAFIAGTADAIRPKN
jgi:quinohemoprotein ethanol dehydrogenase